MKTYRSQESLGNETGTGVEEELHLGNLLIDLFHKVDDEVDKFVFQHSFSVEVGDQERDVVTLFTLY